MEHQDQQQDEPANENKKSIFSAPGRVFSTLVAMLHTRLDLISVELEEELLRFSSYFVYAIAAFFCGAVAIVLTLVLIISLYWETHRVGVLISLITLFTVATIFIIAQLKTQLINKPHLLGQSIAEFKKDAALLHPDEEESV